MARFFIDRPIFAWVLAIVVMLAGALATVRLPLEQYPDIAPTRISVSATYPGASARTLEDSVTQVIEQKMKGLDGLLAMSSTSASSGQASVSLSFNAGTNADIALMQVQSKVQQAMSQLPQAVQSQGVTVTKTGTDFLMIVALYSADGSATNIQIGDYITSNLADVISRLDGVGDVQTLGTGHAMRLWLDPARLTAHALMPSDIASAVTAQNAQVSAGQVGGLPAPIGQQLNVTITARSKLQTVREFREIVLKTAADGSAVRLGDVARVELGGESYNVSTRFKGKPSAAMGIRLAQGANAITVADTVKARLAALQPGFPYQLQTALSYDTSPFVKVSIEEVVVTLLEAVGLVVLIMYLFLQNWRATLIPAITVPVVLLGTLGVLSAFGYSINSLTMFGMVLAIGLLVDDAIVVVENVERVMAEEGLPPREATRRSMQEITGALVGIALVLAAVFVPMAFFAGSTGVIYRQFSITIVSAMGLSVAVAMSLTPALCATLLRPLPPGTDHHTARGGPLGRFFGAFNRGFDRSSAGLTTLTGRLVQRGGRMLLVYALIVAGMVALYRQLPTSFLPAEDQGVLMGEVRLPSGATNERLLKSMGAFENWLSQQADIDGYTTILGFSGDQATGRAFIRLKDWSERPTERQSAAAIARRANQELAGLRDARVFLSSPPTVRGLGSSGGFTLQLQDRAGLGHEALVKARDQLLQAARQRPELAQVRSSGLDDAAQLGIRIDDRRAGALGLATADINSTLSAALGGQYVNDFIDQGRVKKVYLQADAPFRSAPEAILPWTVRSSSGAMVPFSAFASTEWTFGAPRLERYNGLSAYEIVGEAAPGVSSGQAMVAIEALVADLPPGFGIEWSGQSYQERLSGAQAPILYAVSILFVFLCLAALYESWSVPFSVMLVVPLGVVGALGLTWMAGLSNDVYFQVGLLTTVGLAAKNAILIVEFAKHLQEQGMEVVEAVKQSVRLRLRPILMTSLAFMFGVLPLVLSTGAGAGSRRAIGTGVLGGMASATVLGVLFVPVFFVVVRGVFRARRMAVAASAVAAATVLGGCGSLTPAHVPPVAPVASAWPVAVAAAVAPSAASAPSAQALGWSDLVTDARLREVIARALDQNRDLRVAMLNIELARATYRIQRAAQRPTLNATGALSASGTPAEAASSGRDTVSRQYSVGLGLTAFELDLFGRVDSLSASALQSFLQTEAAQQSTRLSLVAEVATAWLTLGADRQQSALLRRTLASQQETLALTERRQALGAVSGQTVAQVQTAVESARGNVALYESQVQRDRHALELLVGQALPDALLPGEDAASDTAAVLVAVPPGLPSEVLQRRPDVQAAEFQLRAAHADLGAARAARFPRISLTASAGTASRSLADLFQGGAWSFVPSITLPMLDGGASETAVRRAEVTRDVRVASYDKAVQTAFREVADALSVRAWLAERLSAQRALVAASARSAALAQARWKAGADTYLAVLDADRTLLAAQQALITLVLTEQGNRVTLYKVLGGAGAAGS
jgi:hydrophobe/amphiphile efflux-1 (HAE1) family protein/NodT family efflux transporter outer membrane factor (OMF) lipoprotein